MKHMRNFYIQNLFLFPKIIIFKVKLCQRRCSKRNDYIKSLEYRHIDSESNISSYITITRKFLHEDCFKFQNVKVFSLNQII